MKERRYSLSEIDKMRAALNRIYITYWHIPPEESSGCYFTCGVDYNQHAAMIEDKLRTYMIGGASLAELEDKAAEEEARRKKEYDEEMERRAERRLIKEYGPRA